MFDREKTTAAVLFVATSLAIPVLMAVTATGGQTGQAPFLFKAAELELKLDALMDAHGMGSGEEAGRGRLFSPEAWLAATAEMEESDRALLIKQLAVACKAAGREDEGLELARRAGVEFTDADPFHYLFIDSEQQEGALADDVENWGLPEWLAKPLLAGFEGGGGGLEQEELASTLSEGLQPFAVRLGLFGLFMLGMLVGGTVLLGLLPRLIRKRFAPVWTYGVNRFGALPTHTYVLFLVWFMLVNVVGVLFYEFGSGEMPRAVLLLVTYLVTAAAGVLLVKYRGEVRGESLIKAVDLDLPTVGSRTVLMGLGGYVIAVPVVVVLYYVSAMFFGAGEGPNPAIPVLLGSPSSMERWIVVANVVVLAPLFEEFFFRGFLFQQFRGMFGAAHAMALSGLVFAAAHQSIDQFLPLLGLGVILAAVYHYSQSLWASMLTHALWNTGTIVGIYVLYA